MSKLLIRLLQGQLEDSAASWSIGAFGALGEFNQPSSQSLTIDDYQSLTCANAKGAIRIDSSQLEQVTAIAYESLSARRWNHGLALCLSQADAAIKQYSGITELGPDNYAIRSQDYGDILFDTGLGSAQVAFCIRTSDPQLVTLLRRCKGQSLTQLDCPAMAAIIASKPHCVMLSKLARIERYKPNYQLNKNTPFSAPNYSQQLAKLFATSSTNQVIPEHLAPCIILHPANPNAKDSRGKTHFNGLRHDYFQALLQQYGDAEYLRHKQATLKSFAKLKELPQPKTLTAHQAIKNTLHQLANMRLRKVQKQWIDKGLKRSMSHYRTLNKPTTASHSRPQSQNHSTVQALH